MAINKRRVHIRFKSRAKKGKIVSKSATIFRRKSDAQAALAKRGNGRKITKAYILA